VARSASAAIELWARALVRLKLTNPAVLHQCAKKLVPAHGPPRCSHEMTFDEVMNPPCNITQVHEAKQEELFRMMASASVPLRDGVQQVCVRVCVCVCVAGAL